MTIEREPHFRPGHCASAETHLQLGPDHHSIRQYGATITSVRPKSSPSNSNGGGVCEGHCSPSVAGFCTIDC